jgi:hypothetical protein
LAALSPMAGMTIAYKLAELAAPLAVGKGASDLIKDIRAAYVVYKTEAQERDMRENFNFEDETIRSEFVRARMS